MIFLIVLLGTTPTETRQSYSALLVIPLACMLMVGAISLLFDRSEPQQYAIRPPEISSRCCDCVWASIAFRDLSFGNEGSNDLQFRRVIVQKSTSGAKWQQSEPASIAGEVFSNKPTCACCLEDFQPLNQVAVLPCGHIFHEECIAHWSIASSKSANSCPTCRKSFECLMEP